MKIRKFLVRSLVMLVILITTFSQINAQKINDFTGSWGFEKIAKSNATNETSIKEKTKTFKVASFKFLKNETYTLKFNNGYVLKGSYELEDDNKLQLGTQQDGSEINGFMNYYVYQLVF